MKRLSAVVKKLSAYREGAKFLKFGLDDVF